MEDNFCMGENKKQIRIHWVRKVEKGGKTPFFFTTPKSRNIIKTENGKFTTRARSRSPASDESFLSEKEPSHFFFSFLASSGFVQQPRGGPAGCLSTHE